MSKLGKKINESLYASSPLMAKLGKVADFILLGILTFIISLPIITCGAAMTAMFYTAFKLLRGSDEGILKPFFSSFKSNFKQSTILWLITLLALGVIVVDVYFYLSLSASAMLIGMFLFAAFLTTSVIVLVETIYVYPYVARFHCTNMQAIKSSSFLGVKHLPSTIIMIVADVLMITGCIFVPLMFLFLPGAIAFIHGYLIHRIFMKYIPKSAFEHQNAEEVEEAEAFDENNDENNENDDKEEITNEMKDVM